MKVLVLILGGFFFVVPPAPVVRALFSADMGLPYNVFKVNLSVCLFSFSFSSEHSKGTHPHPHPKDKHHPPSTNPTFLLLLFHSNQQSIEWAKAV